MSEHTARRPAGTVIIAGEFGRPVEMDTLQCRHCGCHWLVQPGSGRKRGWCWHCAGPTCGHRACETRCLPQEKWMEQVERRATRALRLGPYG